MFHKSNSRTATGSWDDTDDPTRETVRAVEPDRDAPAFDTLAPRRTPESREMHTLEECAELAGVARTRMALLTQREWQILEMLVDGRSNKTMAYELGISPRTVEIHRAAVMRKMETKNVCELVRLALGATAVPITPVDPELRAIVERDKPDAN